LALAVDLDLRGDVLSYLGLGAIVLAEQAEALKWIGLALIGANVVVATLYLAAATATDWAELAHAGRSRGNT
jgi:hypothetical protein